MKDSWMTDEEIIKQILLDKNATEREIELSGRMQSLLDNIEDSDKYVDDLLKKIEELARHCRG